MSRVLQKNAGDRPLNPDNDDKTIDQVRDLLFGDAQRGNVERMEAVERRFSEFEKTMLERLNQIDQRIEALSGSVAEAQRDQILAMGEVISNLGSQFKGIADDTARSPQRNASKSE